MAKRFVIIGSSSSGKTTFAKKLANKLNIPHKELDEFNWGPNWTMKSDEVFFKELNEFTNKESWIVDGNYSKSRYVLWPKADVIIWLNYPLWLVLKQFFSRSLRRSFTKEELWNGNTESIYNSILSKDSLLLWILQNFKKYQKVFSKLIEENPYNNKFYIVRSHKESQKLLEEL